MQSIDLSHIHNKKIGLVLSGGVVKASAWHLGVTKALTDNGFSLKSKDSKIPSGPLEISTYVGSSAGALVNLYFACGYTPQEIIDSTIKKISNRLKPVSYKEMFCFKRPKKKPPQNITTDLFKDWPFLTKQLIKPLINISGFFSTQGIYNYINNELVDTETFNDFACDMFVIATQLDHSRKVIFSKYNYPTPNNADRAYYTQTPNSEAIAASMSVPPLYTPFPINNNYTGMTDYYIDGEIRETLSTHVAVDNGCDVIFCSWTHTPYHYSDELGSLVSYGLPAISLQTIYLMIQKKIISSRKRMSQAKDVISIVNKYLNDNNFPKEKTKTLINILEAKLEFKSNVKVIDIFPEHEDFKFFFKNSFSLNPQSTGEVVDAAYRRTVHTLEKCTF